MDHSRKGEDWPLHLIDFIQEVEPAAVREVCNVKLVPVVNDADACSCRSNRGRVDPKMVFKKAQVNFALLL